MSLVFLKLVAQQLAVYVTPSDVFGLLSIVGTSGDFMKRRPLLRVSAAGSSPEQPFIGAFMGLTMTLLQGRSFDLTRKTSGGA